MQLYCSHSVSADSSRVKTNSSSVLATHSNGDPAICLCVHTVIQISSSYQLDATSKQNLEQSEQRESSWTALSFAEFSTSTQKKQCQANITKFCDTNNLPRKQAELMTVDAVNRTGPELDSVIVDSIIHSHHTCCTLGHQNKTQVNSQCSLQY